MQSNRTVPALGAPHRGRGVARRSRLSPFLHFQVIFDPDVYPLNWACWDGRVSRHWQGEEHPLDLPRAEEELHSIPMAAREPPAAALQRRTADDEELVPARGRDFEI